MQYAFFDIHSHLHDKAFSVDREEIISEMKQKGFGSITVGTGLKESRDAVALADAHPNIFATVGLHPADNILEEYDGDAFLQLAQHEKVVAIGECGLDYYYIETFFEKDQKEKGNLPAGGWNKDAESDRQKRIFEKQIDLAVEVGKPLMLHGRPSKGSMDAYEDMLYMLERAKEKYGEKLQGNAHFFAGNIDIAKRFLDIGFTMSFSGVITFAHDYDDVVRYVPLTMMHAETDSPYATPAPFRGQRNSSLMVQEIVARIAVLREQPMEEVRVQLIENARRVFRI
ncbi:MAG: TatD family hydrolase [Candidatus Paceibacterota bacterium]